MHLCKYQRCFLAIATKFIYCSADKRKKKILSSMIGGWVFQKIAKSARMFRSELETANGVAICSPVRGALGIMLTHMLKVNQMGVVFLSKICGCLTDFLFKLADIAGGTVKTGTKCNFFHSPIG